MSDSIREEIRKQVCDAEMEVKLCGIAKYIGPIETKLRTLIADLQCYYSGKQKRHPASVSQRADYSYTSVVGSVALALQTCYTTTNVQNATLLPLINFQSVEPLRNEISGLLQANEEALRKMGILKRDDQLSREKAHAIQRLVHCIIPLSFYQIVGFQPHIKISDFEFLDSTTLGYSHR